MRDAVKRMEVGKRKLEEVQEKNATLDKQNKKLVAELQELAEDDLRIKQIENRNNQAIIDGSEMNAEQLKQKLRDTQDAQVKDRREFDAAQAAISQEMQITRDANIRIKEDYEILEERFSKNQKLNENLVNDLKVDHVEVVNKNKKLQEFKDKYDVILQDEKNASQTMQKKLISEKEEIERNLTKQLDESNTELETLKGEFKVKMMKI